MSTQRGAQRLGETHWWTPRWIPNEPFGLWRLFVFASILMVTGVLLSSTVAISQGLWSFQSLPRGETRFRCTDQLTFRSANQTRIEVELRQSEGRLDALRKALFNPSSPGFVGSRQAIAEEERAIASLKKHALTYEVQSLRTALSGMLASLLVTLGFSFLAARLMLLQAIHIVDEGSLNGWRRPYVWWTVLFVATLFTGQVLTSILTVEKTWFGAGSFCVSAWTWTLNLIMYAGMALAVAYPATMIWCLSRRELCPRELDFSATDGSCGVGDYLLFLQTWSVSIIVFILVGSVIWLNLTMDAARLSQVYFAPIAVVTGSAFWVGGRLYRNAICIRLLYRQKLRASGETWEDIQTRKPPGDPTINFLGEHWLKLPTTVIAAITALWTIAKWLLKSDLTGGS